VYFMNGPLKGEQKGLETQKVVTMYN